MGSCEVGLCLLGLLEGWLGWLWGWAGSGATYQYGAQYGYYTEQDEVYNVMLLWDPYPWIVKFWTLEIVIKGGRIVVGTPYHQRNPPNAAHFRSNRAEWCPPFLNVFYKGK